MRCPSCGNMTVPYPLSTGPSCGDQLYKVRCSFGTLFFDTFNGSSYVVSSINPQSQRLVNHACMSADFRNQGIFHDPSLPFNITGSNTLVLMNCSTEMLSLILYCTPTSICHAYLRDNPLAAASCSNFSLCCSLKTGGSQNKYRIRIRQDRCAAYQNFVNLDTSLPVSKWPAFRGVELEWELPQEPLCTSQVDCQNSANSMCSVDPMKVVQKRCFRQSRFQWNPIAGQSNISAANIGINQFFNYFLVDIKCPRPEDCKKQSKSPLIGGLTFSATAVLFSFTVLFVVHRQREHIKREAQLSLTKMREDILNANCSSKSAKIFTGKEVTRATSNFSRENLLGAGGFGEVFKGNLFDLLHDTYKCKWAVLTWYRRLNIAHQTAEGLAYLHTSAIPPIFHRDVKSSNILLDEKLDAKVSDFGLSRLVEIDATHITTYAQGTFGYLDLEYCLNFQLTNKSDIYNFGVVLIELLTSKKAIDFNRDKEEVNLAIHIKKILKEERLMDTINPAIKEDAKKLELETMKALGYLASSCLDERRHNRPNMKEVADEIEYIISTLQGG
ncbi:hypothetical protein BT93_H1824 [Corymbia citriodora subsp. variegata]|nr:hypothetical protein BT93_H1824 [Corymbia citriodora subsp. variegata]